MDITQAKADLRRRQEPVVKRLNEVIALEQALAKEKAELVEEALRLNGENRCLARLAGGKINEN